MTLRDYLHYLRKRPITVLGLIFIIPAVGSSIVLWYYGREATILGHHVNMFVVVMTFTSILGMVSGLQMIIEHQWKVYGTVIFMSALFLLGILYFSTYHLMIYLEQWIVTHLL